MNGERLEFLIETSGLEKQEVAAALEVHPAVISRHLRSRYDIPEHFSEKAEKFFAEEAPRILRGRIEALEEAKAGA